MSEPLTLLVSPAASGKYVAFDSEGEARIQFDSDASQVTKAMALLAFEKGTVLRITVEEAS